MDARRVGLREGRPRPASTRPSPSRERSLLLLLDAAREAGIALVNTLRTRPRIRCPPAPSRPPPGCGKAACGRSPSLSGR